MSETAKIYYCTRERKCGWIGTLEEMVRKPGEIAQTHVCPKCGNEEFYSRSYDPRRVRLLRASK